MYSDALPKNAANKILRIRYAERWEVEVELELEDKLKLRLYELFHVSSYHILLCSTIYYHNISY